MGQLIQLPNRTWQDLDGVQEPFSIRQFRGVSTLEPMAMEPGFASLVYNTSASGFPALAVRGGAAKLTQFTPAVRFETVNGRTGVLVEEGTSNLAINPSFEIDSNGDGLADNWNLSAGTGISVVASLVTSPRLHGSYAQKLEVTNVTPPTGTRFHRIEQTVSVTPNQTYSLSVNALTSTTVYDVDIRIRWRDSEGNIISEELLTSKPTDLTRLSVSGTAPSNAVTAIIYLGLRRPSPSDTTLGYVIFDAVQFEAKPYATSWTEGTRAAETLTVPTAGVLDPQEGTIEAWVYVDDRIRRSNTFQTLFSTKGTGQFRQPKHLWLCHNGYNNWWSFFIYDDSGNTSGELWTADDLAIGWHLLTCRWSPAEASLWIDGVKKVYKTSPLLPTSFDATAYIGSRAESQYSNTLIGPLRISRRARTDEEIAAAYAAGTSGLKADADTTAFFPFQNHLVGWSPKGPIYATFSRSSDAYKSDGTRVYSTSSKFGVTALGYHPESDSFLAVSDGNANKVDASGSVTANLRPGLSTTSRWAFTTFRGNFGSTMLLAADGNQALKFDGNTVSTLANAPAGLKYITAHANRVYGAALNILYFSALRKAEDWQTANDSGQIVVESPSGNITGVRSGLDKLVVFKRNSIHELYGTGPGNFRLILVSDQIGCVANNSAVTLNGVMRWLGADGIYEYAGGSAPRKDFALPVQGIVDRVTKGYEDRACAATDGKRYYLALPIDGSTDPNVILEYDPTFQTWMVWHLPGKVLSMAARREAVYVGLDDGRILLLDPNATTDDGSSIPWVWESPPIGSGSYITRKRWYDMWLVVDLPSGSSLDVYLSPKPEGEDSWTLVRSMTASADMQSVRIILPVNTIAHANWARIRLMGTGPCKIHELAYRDRVLPI